MKKHLLSFLLFTCVACTRAQDAVVDSLVSVLKNTKDDTTKLRILEDLIDNAPDGVWEKYNEEMGTLSETLMKNSTGA